MLKPGKRIELPLIGPGISSYHSNQLHCQFVHWSLAAPCQRNSYEPVQLWQLWLAVPVIRKQPWSYRHSVPAYEHACVCIDVCRYVQIQFDTYTDRQKLWHEICVTSMSINELMTFKLPDMTWHPTCSSSWCPRASAWAQSSSCSLWRLRRASASARKAMDPHHSKAMIRCGWSCWFTRANESQPSKTI